MLLKFLHDASVIVLSAAGQIFPIICLLDTWLNRTWKPQCGRVGEWGSGTGSGQWVGSRSESVTSRPEHLITGARPSRVGSFPLAQFLFQPDSPSACSEQSLLMNMESKWKLNLAVLSPCNLGVTCHLSITSPDWFSNWTGVEEKPN